MRKPSVMSIVVALMATGAFAQRGQGPGPLVRENATEKISEHVYVIPDHNVGQVPNVGIVVGTHAALVVDTGLGARNGETIVRELRSLTTAPEWFLVTTHFHPEHDLGAGGFPPETKMIRSTAQVREIAASGLETAKRFSGFSPLHAELLAGAEYRRADITFEDQHQVDLGGVRVRIIAMGYNHTRGDQAIFVEPDGVLFSGDVVMTALPNVGGSTVKQWLSSQDRFEQLQPKRIVPSHGPLGDLSLVRTYRAFLTTVQRRVAELKSERRTLDQTTAIVTAELQDKYPGAGARLTGTIRAAYSEAPSP